MSPQTSNYIIGYVCLFALGFTVLGIINTGNDLIVSIALFLNFISAILLHNGFSFPLVIVSIFIGVRYIRTPIPPDPPDHGKKS